MLTHGAVGNASVAIGVGTAVVPLGNHQVLAHADVLIKIIGRVDAGRDALVERLAHQALLVDVVGREHVRTLVRSIRDAGREVVCPSRAVHLVLPVGVGCLEAVDGAHQRGCCTVAIEGRCGCRGDAVVGSCLPVGLPPLCGVEHIEGASHRLQGGIVVQVDGHLAVLALLRCDDDDTVGGTATVDRSRRSILQHLNRLDVGSVERVEVLGRGYAGAASVTMSTPASLPCIELSMLGSLSLMGPFMSITATAPVRSALRCT